MPYELYWDGDVEAVKYYRTVIEHKRKWQNQMLWLQGKYFYDALKAVMPPLSIKFKADKIDSYIEEPYPLTEKESEERELRKQREHYEKMFAHMHAKATQAVKQKV